MLQIIATYHSSTALYHYTYGLSLSTYHLAKGKIIKDQHGTNPWPTESYLSKVKPLPEEKQEAP